MNTPTEPRASRTGRGVRGLELATRDTPHALLRDLKAGRVDPRVLTTSQRRALLVVMSNGRQTSAELGAFFGVSHNTIRSDLRRIRHQLGREVSRTWTVEETIGQLAASAERCTAALMKDGDWAAAWTIQRDFIRTLDSLGLVGRRRVEGVTITVEELTSRAMTARQSILDALDVRLTGEQLVPGTQ